MELENLQQIFDGKMKPANLPLDVLRSITKNFDNDLEIGRGGYGAVYKGLLRDGVVAVKKAWTTGITKDEKFDREVKNLMKVEHRNIVRFLGYCSITETRYGDHDGEYIKFQIWERLLCFDYASNGSLNKHIAGELEGLGWNIRYEIIQGICQGLRYLHNIAKMVHRDLKPDNILLDDLMVPKIADLGISKLLENGTSKNVITTDRAFSMWYCGPEFVDGGAVTRKLDIYSLGVIIIELVTGLRTTPDLRNVLRRWKYRWETLDEEIPSPLCYQQVARCIKIALMCKDKEPQKRPTISNVIDYLNGTKSANVKIGDAQESSTEEIIPFMNNLLWIEPLVLFFPFEVNKDIACTLQLTNETNSFMAFYIQIGSLLQYCTQPNKGIMPPLSGRMVSITLKAQNKAPQDMHHSDSFIVKSTKLDGDYTVEDITIDMFKGNMIDEVNLDVVFEAKLRFPHTSEKITEGMQHVTIIPSVPWTPNSAEASTSEVRSSVREGQIQVDPTELRFPFLPDERVIVSSSIKVVNITDSYIVLVPRYMTKNVAFYSTYPDGGILPPFSTMEFLVTRGAKKSIAQSIECNDKYLLFSTSVREDFSDSAYDGNLNEFYEKEAGQIWHRRDLGVVLDSPNGQGSSDGMPYAEINSSAHKELIQVDPHELRFPFLPEDESISVTFSIKVVNITDDYVAFLTRNEGNVARYTTIPKGGILPPRSTAKLVVMRTASKAVPQSIECNDKLRLLSTIVNKDFTSGSIVAFYETQVGHIWKKVELGVLLEVTSEWKPSDDVIPRTQIISSPVSKELIKVHPQDLWFPFLPNAMTSASTSIKLENITDDYVVYIAKCPLRNKARYDTRPKKEGILPPRSTVDLIVMRTTKKEVPQSIECNDKYRFHSTVVSKDFGNTDLKQFYDTQSGQIWRKTVLGIVLEEPSQLESSDGMPY